MLTKVKKGQYRARNLRSHVVGGADLRVCEDTSTLPPRRKALLQAIDESEVEEEQDSIKAASYITITSVTSKLADFVAAGGAVLADLLA